MRVSSTDLKRYLAHINLKNIGVIGQKKIINSKILIIGLGGIGSPVATYLAAAGVKNIGIVDFDKIEISNLHRQILFSEKDIGSFKTKITKKKILEINSKAKVLDFNLKINKNNITNIAKNFDYIIDGTDNFSAKITINDYCKKLKKKLITGAISKFTGHIFFFNFKQQKSPCLRCFMPEIPNLNKIDCQSEGILGTIGGIVGTIIANEILKEILNFKKSEIGKILIINSESLNFKFVKLNKNKLCKTNCIYQKNNV